MFKGTGFWLRAQDFKGLGLKSFEKSLRSQFFEPLGFLNLNFTAQNLPLVSREWKNGSNSSYNCTPFLHSLPTKGKKNEPEDRNEGSFVGAPEFVESFMEQ